MNIDSENDGIPRYVDLQVNGYAGVDFNSEHLTAEQLHNACQRLRMDGVVGILATIITDTIDRMASRLARLAKLREADRFVQDVVWGIHIEGPFISELPGYVGAHPVSATCIANTDKIKRLLDAASGLTRIVTLAPERDPRQVVTSLLVDAGICVAAGHCCPPLETLDAAIDAGLSMFTHLGNGCPLVLPRHDNIIQHVLSRCDRLWISFIADGVHIPWPALGNYIKTIGIDRCVVVTDAISAATLGPGSYILSGQEVVVDEKGATWSTDRSHLMGSASTMRQMETNLICALDLPVANTERLTSTNPKRILGICEE